MKHTIVVSEAENDYVIAPNHGVAVAQNASKAFVGRFGYALALADGSAIGGDHSVAVVGPRGEAVTGVGGRSYAGHDGYAGTGEGGFAAAGDGGKAIGGRGSIAIAGIGGTARVSDGGTAIVERGYASAGAGGTLIMRNAQGRWVVGVIGEGPNPLKPGVLYRVEGETFVEA